MILLHGTNADMTLNWPYLSPRLAAAGYCVWALDFPERGRSPVGRSARELRRFVRQAKDVTGARRVSMVGHSVGGLVGRYYVRFMRGRRNVDDLISLASPHKGYVSSEDSKTIDDLYNTGCRSCVQQRAGSKLLTRLNKGDMSPGRVSYTQIATIHDQVMTPYENSFLDPDRRVANILLQDHCPDHFVEHVSLAGDDLVFQWIRHALEARGAAALNSPVSCPPV